MLVELRKSVFNGKVDSVLLCYHKEGSSVMHWLVCNTPEELNLCFKILKDCYGKLYVKTI